MKGIGNRSPLTAASAAVLACLGSLTACSSTPNESMPPPPDVRVQASKASVAQDHEVVGRRRRVKLDDEDDTWSAQGLYVGVFGAYEDVIGSDFGDDLVLVGPTDVVIIPDVDADSGYGVSLSYRWRRWELIASYSQFEHDSTFAGTDHQFDTNYIDVNLRYYYWAGTAIQPYLLAGGGISSAEIEDGTTDGVVTRDAKLEDGISLNLGAGLAFYPIPWVQVFGQGMYRFAKFQASNGIDGKLDSDIDSDTWEISVGASLRLLPPRN